MVKTKEEFIKILKHELEGMNKAEADDILLDYEDYFASGLKEGRSEAELAESLGDPFQIARQVKADYMVKQAESNFTAANIFRAIFAIAGLGFVNLFFMIWIFVGLFSALIGIFAATFSVAISGVFLFFASIAFLIAPGFFGTFLTIGVNGWAAMFFAISLSSFGILLLIASAYLAKWFYIITVKYLKFNLNIIKNKS